MINQPYTSCGKACTSGTCDTDTFFTEQQVLTKHSLADCCGGNCTCKPQALKPQQPTPPSREVLNHIFFLTGRCGVIGPGENPVHLYDTISWLHQDLNPKGAMQTLLASQIISSYLVIMAQLHQSAQESILEQANIRINMSTKLMRALQQQLNLLATLKGEKVQSVKVEHLNVNGNSVIGIGGNVEQGGRGHG